jgi:hypothetical protein
MKISPYIIYLVMQPNALLLQQNFIVHKRWVLQRYLSYPDSKRVEPKSPYVCLGRSNHTYSNNMIIKRNVSITIEKYLLQNDPQV